MEFQEQLEQLLDVSSVKFTVDPDQLDQEIVSMPADFATIAEKSVKVTEMLQRAETNLKRIRAAETIRILDGSVKKPTVAVLESMVLLNSKVMEVTDVTDSLKAAKQMLALHLETLRIKDNAVSRLTNTRLSERRSC